MDVHFWRVTRSNIVIDAKKVLEWVNKRRGDGVQLISSFFGLLKLLVTIFIIATSSLYIYFRYPKLILNERLWLLGAIVVFVLSVSGVFAVLN